MICFLLMLSPALTPIVLIWPYKLESPIPWSMITVFPYIPISPAKVTTPEFAASIGYLFVTARSYPRWYCLSTGSSFIMYVLSSAKLASTFDLESWWKFPFQKIWAFVFFDISAIAESFCCLSSLFTFKNMSLSPDGRSPSMRDCILFSINFSLIFMLLFL